MARRHLHLPRRCRAFQMPFLRLLEVISCVDEEEKEEQIAGKLSILCFALAPTLAKQTI